MTERKSLAEDQIQKEVELLRKKIMQLETDHEKSPLDKTPLLDENIGRLEIAHKVLTALLGGESIRILLEKDEIYDSVRVIDLNPERILEEDVTYRPSIRAQQANILIQLRELSENLEKTDSSSREAFEIINKMHDLAKQWPGNPETYLWGNPTTDGYRRDALDMD